MASSFKYIYGPVFSWRLGMSLGVDPLSTKNKCCNFNCAYCQLGLSTRLVTRRTIFVPTTKIIDELRRYRGPAIDCVTFSGRGEPTLARNLGAMIHATHQVRSEKIAVITNASLMYRKDVQGDLCQADIVLAKLDAGTPEMLSRVNDPDQKISFNTLVASLIDFRKKFKGYFALQMMFIDSNKEQARALARWARKIGPDQVEINTPLRPCQTKPLTRRVISDIKKSFKGMNVVSVYEANKEKYSPLDIKKTMDRHGDFINSSQK